MDPVKIGNFIKKLRKDNNLTQMDFANKYGVTYQAVSKWENGINLPDIGLLKQISKDYNISIDELLEGEKNNSKKNYNYLIIISILVVLLVVIIVVFYKKSSDSFEFKTISTTCEQFNVSGSIAYDNDKSSIYISHIDYCGGDDNSVYKEITCNLYETNNNTSTKISSCKSNDSGIKLEDYLKDVKLNIDNYPQTCKRYTDSSLYLEINATDENNKIITYKIPLDLNNNCPN